MAKRILVISLVGVVLAYAAMTNYHRFKSFEWRPATEVDVFEAKIGHGCERVHEVLASKLDRGFRDMRAEPAIRVSSHEEGTWSDPQGRWAGNARQVFQGHDGDGEAVIEQYQVAPELERYYDLPPSQRKRDWMLLYNGVPWESEYYYRGKPAPFHANFIVHLICDDPASTTIQIYEDGAEICIGEWFGLHATSGHLMPNYSYGYHPDCRLVPATRSDRADLLRHVQALF